MTRGLFTALNGINKTHVYGSKNFSGVCGKFTVNICSPEASDGEQKSVSNAYHWCNVSKPWGRTAWSLKILAYWVCFYLCGVLSFETRSLLLAEMQKSIFRFLDQCLFIKLANVFLTIKLANVSRHGPLNSRTAAGQIHPSNHTGALLSFLYLTKRFIF